MGDVTALVDTQGNVVVKYAYDAWGKVLSVTDGSGNAITDEYHVGNQNPFRYRGYYYDTETGFYYLQSRYYDPETGRFLNADEYVSTGQGLLGTNMFAYCGNNPTSRVDDGGEFWHVIGGTLLGGILGGGLEVVRQLAAGTSIKDLDWGAVGIEALSGAATGALLSVGAPAPAVTAGKMLINGTTSVAHSIPNGDDAATTALKASASAIATGLTDKIKPTKYQPKHYKPSRLSEVVSVTGKITGNRAIRGGTRILKTFVTTNVFNDQKIESTLSYNHKGEVILLSWRKVS